MKKIGPIFIVLVLLMHITSPAYGTLRLDEVVSPPSEKTALEGPIPLLLSQEQISEQASAIPVCEEDHYFPEGLFTHLLPKILIHDIERQHSFTAAQIEEDSLVLSAAESNFAAAIQLVTPALDETGVEITIQGSQVITTYKAQGIEYMQVTFFDGRIYKEATVYLGKAQYTLRNINNEYIVKSDGQIIRELDKGITQRDVDEFAADLKRGLVDPAIGTYDAACIKDYLAAKRSSPERKLLMAGVTAGALFLLGTVSTRKVKSFVKCKKVHEVFQTYEELLLKHILFDNREIIPAHIMDMVTAAIDQGKPLNGKVALELPPAAEAWFLETVRQIWGYKLDPQSISTIYKRDLIFINGFIDQGTWQLSFLYQYTLAGALNAKGWAVRDTVDRLAVTSTVIMNHLNESLTKEEIIPGHSNRSAAVSVHDYFNFKKKLDAEQFPPKTRLTFDAIEDCSKLGKGIYPL